MFSPVQFGKYYLTERIAVGGMAEIFKAKLYGVDGFEKSMVVKQILPQYARNEEFIKMFIDEAKIAVTLTHGNIVPIYELGRLRETYFIAMEYVPGRDLAEILEVARQKDVLISPDHAAYIAIEICKGLDYAHRRTSDEGRPLGVVHRDISPPNILISYEGEVKVTDFGIAQAADKLGTTEAGVVKGTFGYMSPGQVRRLAVDHRTDIFSTGILLHELLTGRLPYDLNGSMVENLSTIQTVEPRRPGTLRRRINNEVDTIVIKALAKEKPRRYATAGMLGEDVERYLAGDI